MINMYQSDRKKDTKPVYFQQPATNFPHLYTLENSKVKAVFTDAGAAVCGIYINKTGESFQNIALGFLSAGDYPGNPLHAGAVLGPAAGRIQEGRLPIRGTCFSLTRNDGGRHHLHGGEHGLSRLLWNTEACQKTTDGGILVFSVSLPDQTDGYPGSRQFRAVYTLRGKTLSLCLTAVSDRDTFFNLSGHTYFNLNWACSKKASDGSPGAGASSLAGRLCPGGLLQRLTIPASRVAFNTKEHIPESIHCVDQTAFDFRQPALVADMLKRYCGDPQLQWAKGYNHAFILDRPSPLPSCGCRELSQAAILESEDGSIRLRLLTDAPCLVVYTGGFIDSSFPLSHACKGTGEDSAACGLQLPDRTFPGCAIALEAQDIPDAPNQNFFPVRFTEKGEIFSRLIEYRLEF